MSTGVGEESEHLVQALGAASEISRSQVSRICTELDKDFEAFWNRPLGHVGFPYLFCDATYVKGRVNGWVVSRAVVVVTGVSATGDREMFGVDVGDSEDGSFWTAISEGPALPGAHGGEADRLGPPAGAEGGHLQGLHWGILAALPDHFMRNALAKVPRANFTEVADELLDAGEDLIEFSALPSPHWTRCGRPTYEVPTTREVLDSKASADHSTSDRRVACIQRLRSSASQRRSRTRSLKWSSVYRSAHLACARWERSCKRAGSSMSSRRADS